jgi:hypothetical protein
MIPPLLEIRNLARSMHVSIYGTEPDLQSQGWQFCLKQAQAVWDDAPEFRSKASVPENDPYYVHLLDLLKEQAQLEDADYEHALKAVWREIESLRFVCAEVITWALDNSALIDQIAEETIFASDEHLGVLADLVDIGSYSPKLYEVLVAKGLIEPDDNVIDISAFRKNKREEDSVD